MNIIGKFSQNSKGQLQYRYSYFCTSYLHLHSNSGSVVTVLTHHHIVLDRVSVPSRIAVDISDGTQWRGTEFTCTCFLCKFRTAYLYTYYHKYKVLFAFFKVCTCAVHLYFMPIKLACIYLNLFPKCKQT